MTETKKQLRAEAVERLKSTAHWLMCFYSDGETVRWYSNEPCDRESVGMAMLKDIELLTDDDSTTESLGDEADTRENMESDIRRFYDEHECDELLSIDFIDAVFGWLDRQASITGREWMAYREVLVHENCEQAECITELTAKLADARESLEEAWKDNAELGDQVDELKAKNDAEAQHAREAWRLWGEADVKLERMTAERDQWRDAFEDSERMRLKLIEQVEY